MNAGIVLGEGVLNWPSAERVTNRYGYVTLSKGVDGRLVRFHGAPVGVRGTLTAHVLENRETSHIHAGERLCGLVPDIAPAGEVVALGTGTLRAEKVHGVPLVGLVPADGRSEEWLTVDALRRCHEQTVRLIFTPDGD